MNSKWRRRDDEEENQEPQPMINIKAEDVNQAKLPPNAAEELTKTEVLIHRLMTETCAFKATALWDSFLHSNR